VEKKSLKVWKMKAAKTQIASMYHTLFDNIYTGMLISMYGHELISPTIERTNKQKTIGKKYTPTSLFLIQ